MILVEWDEERRGGGRGAGLTREMRKTTPVSRRRLKSGCLGCSMRRRGSRNVSLLPGVVKSALL